MVYEELRGVTLFIIDDNATHRCFLDGMVRQWRIQAAEAGSGAAGLSKMRQMAESGHPYRVLMVSDRMPDMDGFEVVACMRKDPVLRDTIPVMLLNSRDSQESVQRCQETGVEFCLKKPIRTAELLDVLRKVVAASATHAHPQHQLPACPAPCDCLEV